MSAAADLLRAARAEGLELRPVGDALRIRGIRNVVARWRPALVPHKPALLALLHAEGAHPAAKVLADPGQPAGPTPEQQASRLAELARRARGGGGLGWLTPMPCPTRKSARS
jgi:hypothetical protein